MIDAPINALFGRRDIPLYNHLNLWDIAEDGMVWGTSAEAAFIYEILPGTDVLLESESSLTNHIRQIQSLFCVLPAGASLTFLVEKTPAKAKVIETMEEKSLRADGAAKDILKSRIELLKSRSILDRKQYLILSLGRVDFLALNLLPSIMFKLNKTAKDLENKIRGIKDELLTLEATMIAQLGSMAVGARRLNREQAIHFYWARLNPQRAQTQESPCVLRKELTLRSQVCLSAGRCEKDHLWLDGKYFAGVSLFSFAEEIELGSIENLIRRLPEGSTLGARFMAVDSEKALDRLKKSQKRTSSLVFFGGSKNYEAQARSEELDEFITSVREKGEKPMLFSGFIMASAKDKEELRAETYRATSTIRESLGCESVIEDLGHKRMFLTCLPFGEKTAIRRLITKSEIGAYLAPLSAPWRGTGQTGMAFDTPETDMVHVDPFSEETPKHGMVIGTTGSGKSFAMNYLIMSLYTSDENTRFVVIDIGGSYKRLCHALGGDYFEVSLSEEFAINPFPAKEAILDSQGNLETDLLGYLRILIEKMLSAKARQTEKRIIEAAIRRLYTQSEKNSPSLGDFVGILSSFGSGDDDAREALSMARDLRLFTEGVYGKILNSPSRIDPFSKRITVFDLANLKEHKELQAILIFMISFGLARTLKDKAARKIVVIDEGWEFFNDSSASELVSRLYRTARKFNAAVVSVSQSPKDFLKSQASTAMIANSDWKVFLKLAMGHDALPEFGLNPAQIEAAKSLELKKRQYSEMLFTFGNNSRVVRLRPSPLEYSIATTNAEELALIQKSGNPSPSLRSPSPPRGEGAGKKIPVEV
ncbi:ATP-binding protein [Elusimicrobiota bacterium]